MNAKEFTVIIKYILRSCATIDSRNAERLSQLEHSKYFGLRDIRFVYRTAINNGVFPECPWCKNAITDANTLTLDHSLPKSRGGTDDITNIQPMHKKCNEVKGNIITETIQYQINIDKHIKSHTRSQIEKMRRRMNRQSVIHATDEEELIKKCEKYDQKKYELHKGKSCKHR